MEKLFITSIVFELGICGLVFLKPTLIPRISDMSTFASRIKIWKTSIYVYFNVSILWMGSADISEVLSISTWS